MSLIRFDKETAYTRDFLEDNPAKAQEILAYYYDKKQHPGCECVQPPIPMYIAKRNSYYLAKMPGTGPEHAPTCPSFEVDTHDNGRAGFEQNVIKKNKNGTMSIKLATPLMHKAVVQSDQPIQEREPVARIQHNLDDDKQKKAKLDDLLSLLWEEAELNRWAVYFEGRRTWGVVRSRLLSIADTVIIKRHYLKEILYIPEVFHPERVKEIDIRRKIIWERIMKKNGQTTRFMVVIAKLREVMVTEDLVSIKLAQLSNNIVFWGDKNIKTKLDNRKIQERMADEGRQVITIMVVSQNEQRALLIKDIGFLTTTRDFIPTYTHEDYALQDKLNKKGRFYIKTLRYSATRNTVIPDFLLVDAAKKPIPMLICPPLVSEEELQLRHEAVKRWMTQYGQRWEWDIAVRGMDIPELPPSTYQKDVE